MYIYIYILHTHIQTHTRLFVSRQPSFLNSGKLSLRSFTSRRSRRVTILLTFAVLFSVTRYLSADPFVSLFVHRCIYLSILRLWLFIPRLPISELYECSHSILPFHFRRSLFSIFYFPSTRVALTENDLRRCNPNYLVNRAASMFTYLWGDCTYLKVYHENARV